MTTRVKLKILDDWPLLSKLLDEVIELPADERAKWLDELPPEHAHLKPQLARLLATSEVDKAVLPEWPQYARESSDGQSPRANNFSASDLFAQYRLLRQLGEGGMGTVWLAESTIGAIKIPVALKLPLVDAHLSSSYLRERFERERVILGALNHPNIARLLEAGVTPSGQPFLALEYINGETLLVHCKKLGLSVQKRLALFVQVLKALQYAHGNLIIHRDLKPSNVLVTQTGEVKLLDFGIAKLLDTETKNANETELTQIGGRAMTPDYASPEQIRGNTLTTTSDVYSAGVLLYEMLTGKRPYKLKRRTRAELEEAILTADVSRPSTIIAGNTQNTAVNLKRKLSGDLDTIILKALKKNPTDRYASASALQEDIERHLAGQPVLAQPDSTTYRLQKFLTRNRLPVMAATCVFAALLAGLGVALWQAQAAREQARVAVLEKARAEKHSGSIRKLSTSLMLDVYDKISQLQGATEARAALANNTSQYLAELATDAGDNPEFRLELAEAFRRLGDIQGQIDGPNLGKPVSALASYDEAIHLLQQTLHRTPATTTDLNSLFTLSRALREKSRVLRLLERDQEALDSAQTGLRAATLLANAPGASIVHQLQVPPLIADVARRQAKLAKQTPLWKNGIMEAIVTTEQIRASLTGATVMSDKRAVLDQLAGLNSELAHILRWEHATESKLDAVRRFSFALGIREAQLADVPDSGVTNRSIAAHHFALAMTLNSLGQQSEALHHAQKGIGIVRMVAKSDPANRQALLDIVNALVILIPIETDLGNFESVVKQVTEARSVIEKLDTDLRESASMKENVQRLAGWEARARAGAFTKPGT
jgi:serine/threonine protein kinase